MVPSGAVSSTSIQYALWGKKRETDNKKTPDSRGRFRRVPSPFNDISGADVYDATLSAGIDLMRDDREAHPPPYPHLILFRKHLLPTAARRLPLSQHTKCRVREMRLILEYTDTTFRTTVRDWRD